MKGKASVDVSEVRPEFIVYMFHAIILLVSVAFGIFIFMITILTITERAWPLLWLACASILLLVWAMSIEYQLFGKYQMFGFLTWEEKKKIAGDSS